MKKIIISIAVFLMVMIASAVFASCDHHETDGGVGSSHEAATQHTHEWGKWTVVEKSTCLSEGLSERTCSCGERETKTRKLASHKSSTWIVDKEATATESGKKHQVCSVCNEIFNMKAIPASGVTLLPGITDTYQDPLRPRYELANCRTLEGNPVVVVFFVDDNESHWPEEKASRFMREEILVALEYLEENAKKWGVELSFVTESYSTASCGYEIRYEGTVNPDLFDGGSTKDVLDKAAADIGYWSGWNLYSYYKAKYPNDDIIFLTFLNKPGRSYARTAISTGYIDYCEHCVIFSNDETGIDDDGARASTVAHEILHLFGAEDYYAPVDRAVLAYLTYPTDVMLWQLVNIEDNSIGDCTAYSVGWTDTVPQICYDPEWWEE